MTFDPAGHWRQRAEDLEVCRDNALAQRDEAQERLRRVRRTSGKLINELKSLVVDALAFLDTQPGFEDWRQRAEAVVSEIEGEKSVEDLEAEYVRAL